MSDIELKIFATLALCGGPILFLRGFRDWRVRRLIENTPTMRIRSMPMGLAEITGVVSPRSIVHAPFSGKPCVYWDVDIAVPRRRAGWTIVHRNHSGHPFLLEDETGLALVYPQGAECKVSGTNASVEQCLGLALPECYDRYMKEQHFGVRRAMWGLGPMRFRERIIEEGERIFVLGSAEPRSQSFTISDGDELAATGTDDAAATPPRRAAQRQPSAVIRQGANERTFIISQESERSLLMDMGIQMTAKLVGGPLLAAIGLFIWGVALTSVRGR